MANKNEKSAKKEQYKKIKYKDNILGNTMAKLQNHVNRIGIRDKYIERIKTGYITIFVYLILFYIFDNLKSNIESDPNNIIFAISILFCGIVFCIFNIVKSILSLKDKKYKINNIILIVIHVFFILIFTGCFFI